MVGQHNYLSAFWGKLKSDSNNKPLGYLPLAHHCLDVAIVFRHLTSLKAFQHCLVIAANSKLTKAQLDRLAVFALLHDLGKANLGFQYKPFDPMAPRAGHIFETAPLLNIEHLANKLAQSLDWNELMSWFDEPDTLKAYVFAILSHHGRPLHENMMGTDAQHFHYAQKYWWVSNDQHDPFNAIRELITTARQAFPHAFTTDVPPIPNTTQLQHRFAGLLMLADWLGSHDNFFPIDNGKADRTQLAPEAAKQILKSVGLDARDKQQALRTQAWQFESLFNFTPYPLQQTLDKLPMDNPTHRLLIAEAETGSGKTEAALIRFFRLFANEEVDGLYFALPSRVAAREIYQRVLNQVKKAFPDTTKRPMVLLAVPGYTKIDGQETHLLPDRTTACNDEAEQHHHEHAWAAEHPKRFLAATIAVGTIDQALLSVLQTPHAHLRSACLDRQLLVVDEVHASDPYMRHLLTDLLQHHLRASYALLLSATLGAVAQEAFLKAAGTKRKKPRLEEAITVPYPALTDGAGERIPLKTSSARAKPVTFECVPHLTEPANMLPRIKEALESGARVLVVLNTVGRALNMQRAVEEIIPGKALFHCGNLITPHHGRYSPTDRELLDAAISKRLGKKSPPGPLLLVGTQTLEQSLDIDADILITDLCPMDVLLQRIGRLHRHKRQRPSGMKTARCLLLTPNICCLEDWLLTDGDANGDANGTSKRMGLGSVYPDLRTLQLTWDYFRQHSQIEIPRDNRLLVESTTHTEALAQLQGHLWQKHANMIEGGQIAQGVRADHVSLIKCYKLPFGEFSFNNLNADARTRLGLDSLRLPLPKPMTGPFGVTLTEMLIPGYMAPQNPDTIEDMEPIEGGISFRLCDRHYRYTRHGLETTDESAH
jgi:CRISPR-associated endonuclease/helicase Cas3